MSQSKTYLKFKETRSQEDLETLNSYLKRLSEISDILNGDEDLDNETENKLYDEDEDLTDITLTGTIHGRNYPNNGCILPSY